MMQGTEMSYYDVDHDELSISCYVFSGKEKRVNINISLMDYNCAVEFISPSMVRDMAKCLLECANWMEGK